MSLYIPGLNLPPNCAGCDFTDGIFCTLLPYDNYVKDACIIGCRRKDCPLIEVSPHGRFSIYDGVIVRNDAEPTIIPADVKEGAS